VLNGIVGAFSVIFLRCTIQMREKGRWFYRENIHTSVCRLEFTFIWYYNQRDWNESWKQREHL